MYSFLLWFGGLLPYKIEFEADFLPGVVSLSPSLFRLEIFFFLAAATDQAD